MTKKQKKMLCRILIAAVLFLAAKFIPMPMLVSGLQGHLQPSGVRRKLPDGGRHDRRHRARHL